jgi:hypothetical protein
MLTTGERIVATALMTAWVALLVVGYLAAPGLLGFIPSWPWWAFGWALPLVLAVVPAGVWGALK